MDVETRNKIIKEFFEKRCMLILEDKGEASSGGSDDANANFKQGEGDIDDIHVWWIYYIKHVMRIKDFVFRRKAREENLRETIADLVNYPLILYTILIEKGMVEDNNE